MAIDEAIQQSTIHFPRKMGVDETKKLLNYLTLQLPAEIRYSTNITELLVPDAGREGPTVRTMSRGFTLSGSIGGIGGVTESFEGLHHGFDKDYLVGISFIRIPGFSIHEYRPEVRNLWRRFSDKTQEYFSQNK